MDKEWYHTFFEQDYFRKSLDDLNASMDRAIPEVEFLIDALQIKKSMRILDLCCGDGRHTLNFAQRNYRIVGYDLCEKALRLAKEKAYKYSIDIYLVRGDMRDLPFENEFDAIYNYFNSFGYFEDEAENQRVLEQVSKALKPKGRFLLERTNWKLILKNFRKSIHEEYTDRTIIHENNYDNETKRLRAKWTIIYKDTGESHEHIVSQRFYSIDEMGFMLESVGLKMLNVYGDIQKNKYIEDSKRMIFVAQKV